MKVYVKKIWLDEQLALYCTLRQTEEIKELFNELNDLVAKGKFLDSMLYELKAATYKTIEQKEFDREDKFQFFCDFFF